MEVITLLPDAWCCIQGPAFGMVGRALRQGQAVLHICDLRSYGKGRHRQVDDAPFGGGPGMVVCVEPVHRAICAARMRTPGPVLVLSPRGIPFNQDHAQRLAQGPGMVLVCGRYEGFDERVYGYADQMVSVGDFVMSAGDMAALGMVDAVVRLLKGVLKNEASLKEESFRGGLLESPHYTRPRWYDHQGVPEVLLSGDPAAIAVWRREQALRLTQDSRPDVWAKFHEAQALAKGSQRW